LQSSCRKQTNKFHYFFLSFADKSNRSEDTLLSTFYPAVAVFSTMLLAIKELRHGRRGIAVIHESYKEDEECSLTIACLVVSIIVIDTRNPRWLVNFSSAPQFPLVTGGRV
jgi:succinate dehydrogenase hydrophobic anchor subunit